MGIKNNDNNDNIGRGCITIGRMAPDFTTLSTDGVITLSQFKGKWVVLLAEPANFAAVSTTSIVELAKLNEEFEKRNTQILVVTLDNNFSNIEWLHDILTTYGIIVPFPLLEDRDKKISESYNIVNPDRLYENSVRDLFIINPAGRVSAIITYPVSVGRNYYEVIRVIDALQLTEKYGVFTPAHWVPGKPVMLPTVQTFRESISRQQNSNCSSWHACYVDYYSLVNNNQSNVELNHYKKK